MSSETTQKGKKKRIPKKYNHNLKTEVIDPEHSRQATNLNKVKDINLKRLENYMWTRPTLAMTALFFGVSEDTIESTIKLHYALSFSDFRAQRIMHSKHSLIQKCMQMGLEEGHWPSLKFALQNLADWTEHMQVSQDQAQTITLKYSLEAPPEPPQIKDVTPDKAVNE